MRSSPLRFVALFFLISVALIGAWLLLRDNTDPTPPETATARPPEELVFRQQPNTVSAPVEEEAANEVVINIPADDALPDPMTKWRAIEAAHAARPEAEQAWKEQSVKQVYGYFAELNAKMGADPNYEDYMSKIIKVDCRQKSCVAQLQFADYPRGKAFVEMMEDRRLRVNLGVKLGFDCPLAKKALPRVPGTDQPDFQLLLQFDCGE